MKDVRDGSNYAFACTEVRIFEIVFATANLSRREMRRFIDLPSRSYHKLLIQFTVRGSHILSPHLLAIHFSVDRWVCRVAFGASERGTATAEALVAALVEAVFTGGTLGLITIRLSTRMALLALEVSELV